MAESRNERQIEADRIEKERQRAAYDARKRQEVRNAYLTQKRENAIARGRALRGQALLARSLRDHRAERGHAPMDNHDGYSTGSNLMTELERRVTALEGKAALDEVNLVAASRLIVTLSKSSKTISAQHAYEALRDRFDHIVDRDLPLDDKAPVAQAD
jgi:hypothetical protein